MTMKNLLALLSFALLAGCCSDAFADEFGSRFGSSSPYALGNTMGKAQDNLNGIGLEDLNTINPAAGSADDDTTAPKTQEPQAPEEAPKQPEQNPAADSAPKPAQQP